MFAMDVNVASPICVDSAQYEVKSGVTRPCQCAELRDSILRFRNPNL
jgi:hypothetical protein